MYDIFHNDTNQYVIVYGGSVDFEITHAGGSFERVTCPHKHVTIYTSSPAPFVPQLDLCVNGALISVPVKKYPSFAGEIIMAAIVKNEDPYIVQWIEYHKLLGVTRFIFYDNKSNAVPNVFYASATRTSNLSELLHSYIETGEAVLIDWPFSHAFQQTQQNHAIYAFNTAKYIGLLDIDEYVNPQCDISDLREWFDCMLGDDYASVGSIQMKSKFFRNCTHQSEAGYDFLQVVNCEPVRNEGYEKHFVVPPNVRTFSCHMITDGKPCFVPPSTELFMNHYFFLNKHGRGRDPCTDTDTSILARVLNLHLNTAL